MIHSIGDRKPNISSSSFIAWNAEVSGDVTIKEKASVWFSATLRGDIAPIILGKGSNVQDGAVLHGDNNLPVTIGEDCTIGHNAVVHGCTIGDTCLVGMGAVILSGVEIGSESIIGASALLTQNKKFPSRSLILGNPAKVVKTLSDDDIAAIKKNSAHYVALALEAKTCYKEI